MASLASARKWPYGYQRLSAAPRKRGCECSWPMTSLLLARTKAISRFAVNMSTCCKHKARVQVPPMPLLHGGLLSLSTFFHNSFESAVFASRWFLPGPFPSASLNPTVSTLPPPSRWGYQSACNESMHSYLGSPHPRDARAEILLCAWSRFGKAISVEGFQPQCRFRVLPRSPPWQFLASRDAPGSICSC